MLNNIKVSLFLMILLKGLFLPQRLEAEQLPSNLKTNMLLMGINEQVTTYM